MTPHSKFLFLPLLISLVMMTTSGANDKYKEGADFGHSIQGQGTEALNAFNAPDTFPGFTATPPETGYYGGETSMSNADILNAGNKALNTSEVGKVAQESLLNRPDDQISLDAPFIDNGFQIQDKADIITKGTDEFCESVNVNKTEINTYRCDRSPAIEVACTRTAVIDGDWVDSTADVDVIIDSTQLSFYAYGNGKNREDGARTTYIVTANVHGPILSATMTNSGHGSTYMMMQILGVEVNVSDGTKSFSPGVSTLTTGQQIPINLILSAMPSGTTNFYNNKQGRFTIVLRVRTGSREYKPKVVWTESCPFNKAEEVLITSQCVEAGGNRTITVEGKQYPVYSDCWKYKDTYFSQVADNGTCGKYMADRACTLSSQKCLTSIGNICTQEQVYFSCETKISGEAQLCAGELVCNDGACDLLNNDKSSSFGQAVSGLAALAAAGEDVAALNGVNVTAFTGAPKSCRQAAAGFSNCCKDSGWGASVGLAHCDSEEKALGEAKERLLTVYIGDYCSRKVLGVCLQKKKSYCQFDSKLAQIIQEQGRGWQLGINFGSAESPNCRGITVDELQRILFDKVDFSNFYSDLTDGTTIPVDADIISRVKAQVAASMQQQSTGGQ
ncbi:type-F conjugative transfer system mating-pair stabilization protein TraN [Yersinia enterocolitica]|uniref:type-F conjugative transfer system mating-pair stabilization protein TraN n=1 Tax=Yersinia enterocolitica TaxID=630 RepID=UPI001C8D4451|nr:type-F conjugative transfer system mating-pair stabilization protein TraN [Yersinia enterocolitica]MBX9485945.1 type-F conjugative transfer system mating-pair stabilization protein TraN [Yersinia enterocolitica]MBX9492214.1 type-F conjugative transfer system mating-pair stabilization protein TraN [Yersinia enterocolitica]